jgi:hypothetical protein
VYGDATFHLGYQYVLHILLSWICGCEADLACRNFLIVDEKMYQVDLEGWAKFDWCISETPAGSMRSNANSLLLAFINYHWDKLSLSLAEIKKNALANGNTFFKKRGIEHAVADTIMSRINSLQTRSDAVHVVTMTKTAVPLIW